MKAKKGKKIGQISERKLRKLPNWKKKQRVVNISEDNNIGKDEVYCEWLECPKCKNQMITRYQHYCGNCGSKFKWNYL